MLDAVVVGAGIVGLTSAVRLAEAGARVAVLAADLPRETVSRVAAAVWYPTHTRADPRVLGWAAATFDEFTAQAAAGVPGVVPRPTRMLLRTPTAGPPWWSTPSATSAPPDPPACLPGTSGSGCSPCRRWRWRRTSTGWWSGCGWPAGRCVANG
ncbi:hypothetical protein GCM10027605_46020 [Micromonospora zhanjiangensis]